MTTEKDKRHSSDCAIYNKPAYPAGPCDCGFDAIAYTLCDCETEKDNGFS